MTARKKANEPGFLFSQLAFHRNQLRKKLLATIKDLDPKDPETLEFTVAALLEAHISANPISVCVGMSRTTVVRWAQRENVPRSSGYRQWAVNELINLLEKNIAAETAPSEQQAQRPGKIVRKRTAPEPHS